MVAAQRGAVESGRGSGLPICSSDSSAAGSTGGGRWPVRIFSAAALTELMIAA
jgi:hypothetical protein